MKQPPAARASAGRLRKLCLVMWVACLSGGEERTTLAAGVDAAAGITIDRPLGSELSDVYPWAVGLALDVRIVHSPQVSLSVQTAPLLSWGTPAAGSLVNNPEAQFLRVPGYLILEYAFKSGRLRPYLGAGAGIVYAQERLSFQGPLGERDASQSTTRFSWTLLAGLEQGKHTRPYVEACYQNAGTSGVEGQSGSGESLASLQLRVGVRTRLK